MHNLPSRDQYIVDAGMMMTKLFTHDSHISKYIFKNENNKNVHIQIRRLKTYFLESRIERKRNFPCGEELSIYNN